MQVLSTVPVMFGYWVYSKIDLSVAEDICFQAKGEDTHYLCKYINDDIAKAVAKYPKRFIGLGTLPMQV